MGDHTARFVYWAPRVGGLLTVAVNRGSFENGEVTIERVAETTLPRRDDWLGQ